MICITRDKHDVQNLQCMWLLDFKLPWEEIKLFKDVSYKKWIPMLWMKVVVTFFFTRGCWKLFRNQLYESLLKHLLWDSMVHAVFWPKESTYIFVQFFLPTPCVAYRGGGGGGVWGNSPCGYDGRWWSGADEGHGSKGLILNKRPFLQVRYEWFPVENQNLVCLVLAAVTVLKDIYKLCNNPVKC